MKGNLFNNQCYQVRIKKNNNKKSKSYYSQHDLGTALPKTKMDQIPFPLHSLILWKGLRWHRMSPCKSYQTGHRLFGICPGDRGCRPSLAVNSPHSFGLSYFPLYDLNLPPLQREHQTLITIFTP